MKVEYIERPFKPISITIESEEELRVLRMVLCMQLHLGAYIPQFKDQDKFLATRKEMYAAIDEMNL